MNQYIVFELAHVISPRARITSRRSDFIPGVELAGAMLPAILPAGTTVYPGFAAVGTPHDAGRGRADALAAPGAARTSNSRRADCGKLRSDAAIEVRYFTA